MEDQFLKSLNTRLKSFHYLVRKLSFVPLVAFLLDEIKCDSSLVKDTEEMVLGSEGFMLQVENGKKHRWIVSAQPCP